MKLASQVRRPVVPPSIVVRDSSSVIVSKWERLTRLDGTFGWVGGFQKYVTKDGMGGVSCSRPVLTCKFSPVSLSELARRGWINKGDQSISTHTEPTQVIKRDTARKYEDLSPQSSGQHLILLEEQNMFE